MAKKFAGRGMKVNIELVSSDLYDSDDLVRTNPENHMNQNVDGMMYYNK